MGISDNNSTSIDRGINKQYLSSFVHYKLILCHWPCDTSTNSLQSGRNLLININVSSSLSAPHGLVISVPNAIDNLQTACPEVYDVISKMVLTLSRCTEISGKQCRPKLVIDFLSDNCLERFIIIGVNADSIVVCFAPQNLTVGLDTPASSKSHFLSMGVDFHRSDRRSRYQGAGF